MAIDDNTSYTLTGAQVKGLTSKIKAKAADNIFIGATSAAPGSKGLVPQPQAGDDAKFLSGDGSWQSVTANEIDWTTMPGSYSTTEQPTVTRSLETETITLKKGETEPIEDKTELPTILDEEAEEAEETETTEPEESDVTDER